MTPEANFDVQPSAGNHFAWLRTQLALQRTLLAAVRTTVSLIGFGFTVAQFFQKLVGTEATGRFGPETPRNVGLTLIGAGVVSLVIFTWQYHRSVAYLRAEPFAPLALQGKSTMHFSTYFVSGVVLLVGAAAFLSVLMRF